jgi:hypothetical protein
MVAINIYIDFAHKLERSNGPRQTVKILKDLNSLVKLHSLGHNPKTNLLGGTWFKQNKNHLPKALNKLWEICKEDPRVLLFVVNLVYTLKCKPNHNIETITKPSTTDYMKLITPEFLRFVQSQVKSCSDPIIPSMLHFSLRAGPLGPLTIMWSGVEALLLYGSEVFTNLKKHCSEIGYEGITNRIQSINDWVDRKMFLPTKISIPRVTCFSRLAYLSDKAGKTRVMCIVSYWVQELLKPLHDAMFRWLRTNDQDATYNQTAAVEKIKNWSKGGKPLYSYDLTAATDRWPMIFQYEIIKVSFGSKWADAWKWSMSLEPYCSVQRKLVKYEVGQPMGAYASWAALSMAHHLLVRWSAFLTAQPLDEYVVLGDDIVIANSITAKKYYQLIQQLGVSISTGKSLVFHKNKPNSAEFAKHLIKEGVDLTPLSPNLLLEIKVSHFWYKVPEVCREIWDRYEYVPIVLKDDELYPSPVLEFLMSEFSISQKSKILTALVNPFDVNRSVPKEWILKTEEKFPWKLDDNTKSWDPKAQPNPWTGISNLNYSMCFARVIQQETKLAYENLAKLRDDLSLSLSSKAGPKSLLTSLLIHYPHHPVKAMLDGLEGSLRVIAVSLATENNEDTAKLENLDVLLIDASHLHKWLVQEKLTLDPRSLSDQIRTKQLNRLPTIIGKVKDPSTWYFDDMWDSNE